MKAPEPWNDEEAIEADMQLWLQSHFVEHDEAALEAFRIGWRAGAYYSAFQMLHWTRAIILGIEEPERNEPNERHDLSDSGRSYSDN